MGQNYSLVGSLPSPNNNKRKWHNWLRVTTSLLNFQLHLETQHRETTKDKENLIESAPPIHHQKRHSKLEIS